MSGLKIVVCDHGIDLTQAQCLICQSPQLAEAKTRIAALEARCAEAEGDMHGCLMRWREALERPYPAVGVMREPAESLYRATEKIRAERDAAVKELKEGHDALDKLGVERRWGADGVDDRMWVGERIEALNAGPWREERNRADQAEADLAAMTKRAEELQAKLRALVCDYDEGNDMACGKCMGCAADRAEAETAKAIKAEADLARIRAAVAEGSDLEDRIALDHEKHLKALQDADFIVPACDGHGHEHEAIDEETGARFCHACAGDGGTGEYVHLALDTEGILLAKAALAAVREVLEKP